MRPTRRKPRSFANLRRRQLSGPGALGESGAYGCRLKRNIGLVKLRGIRCYIVRRDRRNDYITDDFNIACVDPLGFQMMRRRAGDHWHQRQEHEIEAGKSGYLEHDYRTVVVDTRVQPTNVRLL